MFEFLGDVHWLVLFKIILIDLIMGVDNAIVIAMAVSALAVEHRNKAVVLGTAGAILARIVFLFVGFWLVGIPFVKLLAGAYLVYLAFGMLGNGDDDPNVKSKASLWGASLTIITADIALSLDNVVALVGVSEGTGDHAFGYTVFGILLSIPIIVLASKYLISLLDKFPIILLIGSAFIAHVGIGMLLSDQVVYDLFGYAKGSSELLYSSIVMHIGLIGAMVYTYFKHQKE